MELRAITFYFCVILGSDWQAIIIAIWCMFYMFYYAFYINCICFVRSICDTEINLSNTIGKNIPSRSETLAERWTDGCKNNSIPTKKFAGGINI